MGKGKAGYVAGSADAVVDHYAPELLYPIPRDDGATPWASSGALPFYGVDLWHAYEMSWLDAAGKPVARVGRFSVPASSPNMVESKSFKLYLNSLNSTRFANEEEAPTTIGATLPAWQARWSLWSCSKSDDPALAGSALPGSAWIHWWCLWRTSRAGTACK